jgi:hypothetical protein
MRYTLPPSATMTVRDTIDNGPAIKIRALLDNDDEDNSAALLHAALQDYILTGRAVVGVA